MIAKQIDFSVLFSKIVSFFLRSFGREKYSKIRTVFIKNLNILSAANLSIYQANMRALEFRKRNYPDLMVYSRLELQARKFGERRVRAKSALNVFINAIYPTKGLDILPPSDWMSDDIVYSVAEMLDRLIIEEIKRADYAMRMRTMSTLDVKSLKRKIALSNKWSRAVKRFLEVKLEEIERKGYYECVEETRTYSLEGIKKLNL